MTFQEFLANVKVVYGYIGWQGLLWVALGVRQFIIKDWALGLVAFGIAIGTVIVHFVKK